MRHRDTLAHLFHKSDLVQKLQKHHHAAKWRQRTIRLLQQHLLPTENPPTLCFHSASLCQLAGSNFGIQVKWTVFAGNDEAMEAAENNHRRASPRRARYMTFVAE